MRAGAETFEESEDFDVDDDIPDPTTPYEADFDPPISELVEAGSASIKEKQSKALEKAEKEKLAKEGGVGGKSPT